MDLPAFAERILTISSSGCAYLTSTNEFSFSSFWRVGCTSTVTKFSSHISRSAWTELSELAAPFSVSSITIMTFPTWYMQSNQLNSKIFRDVGYLRITRIFTNPIPFGDSVDGTGH